MDRGIKDAIRGHLKRLYPQQLVNPTLSRLITSLERFALAHPDLTAGRGNAFDETDVWLIAYGDHVRDPGRPPLESLERFLTRHVDGIVGGVHLLPHYPWTSDDGFAVVDYSEVDPRLGGWEHVEGLGSRFRLMLDAVVNHTSASSPWFQGWLQDDPAFADFYLSFPEDTPLDEVVRPRTTPLLTPFKAAAGVRHVWTTFGPDQVDLNYANPEVLLRVTDVLLDYVARGASALRLDAIAFLWKRIGTTCIHLAETHEVIRLWRTVVDAVAPDTLIVTETNVPHAENLSYFGDGSNEAHLVYQFPLPPLTLHAFRHGDATILAGWLASLDTPSRTTTFLNFLSSHDGIGLRPVEALLPTEDILALSRAIESEGGSVSYKAIPGMAPFPYELNVTYYDALNPPGADEPVSLQIDRFVAAQSLLLALAGVPAIYLHSLLGSRNWTNGVRSTGRPRAINREKLDRVDLEADLSDPASRRAQVFDRVTARMVARSREPAFHPSGAQRLLRTGPEVVGFEREALHAARTVVCLHNVTAAAHRLRLTAEDGLTVRGPWEELSTGRQIVPGADGELEVALDPYEVLWLRGAA